MALEGIMSEIKEIHFLICTNCKSVFAIDERAKADAHECIGRKK